MINRVEKNGKANSEMIPTQPRNIKRFGVKKESKRDLPQSQIKNCQPMLVQNGQINRRRWIQNPLLCSFRKDFNTLCTAKREIWWKKRNQKETSHRALHLISNVHLGSWLCYSHKPTQPENIIGYSLLLLLTDRIVWKLYDQFYRQHYSILHKSTDIHMNSNMFEFPAKMRLFSKGMWSLSKLVHICISLISNWPFQSLVLSLTQIDRALALAFKQSLTSKVTLS